jgi:hypothetical protein
MKVEARRKLALLSKNLQRCRRRGRGTVAQSGGIQGVTPRVGAQRDALPVFGDDGGLPGLDVTRSSTLRDLMDEGFGLDAMR